MALRDLWRRQRDDGPIPDEVQAQTEAVDAILRGATAPEGMEDLDDLVRDLRSDRPAPDQGFATELDEWASEGFARGGRPGEEKRGRAVRGGGLSMRRLAPAGALAATVLVAAVAVSQIGDGTDEALDDGGVVAEEVPAATEDASPADAVGSASSPAEAAGQLDRGAEREGPPVFAVVVVKVPSSEVQSTRAEVIAVARRLGGRPASATQLKAGASSPLELVVPAGRVGAAVSDIREVGADSNVELPREVTPADAAELTISVRIVAK